MTRLECLMVALIDYEVGPDRAKELVALALHIHEENTNPPPTPRGVMLRDTREIDAIARELAAALMEGT